MSVVAVKKTPTHYVISTDSFVKAFTNCGYSISEDSTQGKLKKYSKIFTEASFFLGFSGYSDFELILD